MRRAAAVFHEGVGGGISLFRLRTSLRNGLTIGGVGPVRAPSGLLGPAAHKSLCGRKPSKAAQAERKEATSGSHLLRPCTAPSCSLNAPPCSLVAPPCSPRAPPCSFYTPFIATLLPFPTQNSNLKSWVWGVYIIYIYIPHVDTPYGG